MGTQEGGPGYPRHRDYSGIRHGGTDGLIRAEHSNPHTRTLTVSQDTNNGSEVEAVETSNRGGLGPVTHSFPPGHQGGRGTTIERQPLPCQQPTKEVYLTPLCMNNSGTNRSPNSVSPHSGVHPTCLTILKRTHIEGWDPPPSHQGVDGAVACRPRSTG